MYKKYKITYKIKEESREGGGEIQLPGAKCPSLPFLRNLLVEESPN